MLFVLKSIHYTVTLKQDISLRRSSLQYARHFLFYLPPFSFTFPTIFSLTFTAIFILYFTLLSFIFPALFIYIYRHFIFIFYPGQIGGKPSRKVFHEAFTPSPFPPFARIPPPQRVCARAEAPGRRGEATEDPAVQEGAQSTGAEADSDSVRVCRLGWRGGRARAPVTRPGRRDRAPACLAGVAGGPIAPSEAGVASRDGHPEARRAQHSPGGVAPSQARSESLRVKLRVKLTSSRPGPPSARLEEVKESRGGQSRPPKPATAGDRDGWP